MEVLRRSEGEEKVGQRGGTDTGAVVGAAGEGVGQGWEGGRSGVAIWRACWPTAEGGGAGRTWYGAAGRKLVGRVE